MAGGNFIQSTVDKVLISPIRQSHLQFKREIIEILVEARVGRPALSKELSLQQMLD